MPGHWTAPLPPLGPDGSQGWPEDHQTLAQGGAEPTGQESHLGGDFGQSWSMGPKSRIGPTVRDLRQGAPEAVTGLGI